MITAPDNTMSLRFFQTNVNQAMFLVTDAKGYTGIVLKLNCSGSASCFTIFLNMIPQLCWDSPPWKCNVTSAILIIMDKTHTHAYTKCIGIHDLLPPHITHSKTKPGAYFFPQGPLIMLVKVSCSNINHNLVQHDHFHPDCFCYCTFKKF